LPISGPEDEEERVNLQILEHNGASLAALRRLGKIAKDRGDSDAAIAYFRPVLDLNPSDTIAKNQLDRLQGGPVRSAPRKIDLVPIHRTMETLLSVVRFRNPSASGPVDVQWPAGIEHFPEGWDFETTVGGRTLPMRHLLGHRVAYRRLRRRTLTMVRNNVEVEGVAADDYAKTAGLLGVLRNPDGTHVRSKAELPGGYAGFLLVWHHEEILEAGSPQSLAVKLLEDDVTGWASHALLRAAGRGRLS
jgi:hypothetical protein